MLDITYNTISENYPQTTEVVGSGGPLKQPFDYYCVLDLEGKVEILELPVQLINSKTLGVESVFHKYIRPTKMEEKHVENYVRGKYGKMGLAEKWFETAIPFPDALKQLDEWLEETGAKKYTFAFVTCGNWDIKTQIPKQCSICSIPIPSYFNQWVNLKDVYLNFYHHKALGMRSMLNGLRIKLEGTHHSGLDDTSNIVKVLLRMIQDGAEIKVSAQRLNGGKVKYLFEDRIIPKKR